MPVFRDQLSRKVELSGIPKRIISIVPSQTELLFYLGLNVEVIGITKFCIHPADRFNSTTKVGGTKQLDIEKIRLLNPDLIIANKEENDHLQVEELMNICPVWISDIFDLESALQMIVCIGNMIGKPGRANVLCTEINGRFKGIKFPVTELRVAYLIWRKPYMLAGRGTFIDSMLQTCGLNNVTEGERYPEIDADALAAANPDLLFLSSEPYPFAKKHIEEFRALLPNAKIVLVDGEMFSWYGSRLLYAPVYFKQLTNGLLKN
ncbi:ABC transporter substrate-binding protein [Mucilaginibacter rubeus]|uniref:ABC transporter substrate-binding protein n=1 Tax=Mucilaginibacter rubeus TaxID=2027860 RepID=A0AAE6JD17_9SPHI|nr:MULTISPECIES: helical backbone metal receptor [Mucilaginibacter]QEM03429.1 ABC transporter substrate-binding protein [Mucilaginibacter rubeus]QEM16044.1 ABC transporter substrate-binding protein [Mucilaginibacter gossypii]QTE41206.1 ABC transporter substrate-binding protein [Mucilaginibacter rubeus]QTE47810.1 ABC transporter substrate-binding protein [Mucilaginibacter rubeus]QTE59201.1 ABC transporter substrate-binding protein [Mucilaginibacter rubeus]